MKHVTQSIVLIAGAILASQFLFSADQIDAGSQPGAEKYQLPDLQVSGIDSLPVPTYQSIPRVSKELAGETLTMKFTIDQKGRVKHVRTAKALPAIFDRHLKDFAVRMTQALKRWKFEPAKTSNGTAVAAKILMPVRVVDREGTLTALAHIKLDLNDS